MRTQLYKNAAGQWIFDGGSMPSGSCYERYRNGTVRIYLLNQAILFEGRVSDLLRGDGTPYENYAVFKSECGDFFVNPLNPLKEDVEGLKLNKADLVDGKVPSEQLPSYVDDVVSIEHFSDTEPVALENELWYDTVNHDLAVYDGNNWLAIDLEYGKIYVNVDSTSDEVNATYRYNGLTLILIGKPITREIVESLTAVRTVNMAAYDVDMSAGEDFTKVCAAGSAFTISNPIIKKPFRLFLTGGTLAATLFTGYTSNWILTSLQSDYVPANNNVLWCEIRSAGQIYLFWGA